MTSADYARIAGRTQMAAALAHDVLRHAGETAEPNVAREIKAAMGLLADALQFARNLGCDFVPATIPAGAA